MKKKSGQSLIEVVVGIVVLVPVVFVLLDFGIILLGVQENEWLCRNASRAAAGGAPSEATRRVQLLVNDANARAGASPVGHFALDVPVQLKISNSPAAEQNQVTGKESTAGGPILGTAAVTTVVEIRPFIIHSVMGHNQALRFRARTSCPISYVIPASTPVAARYVPPSLE